MFLELLFGLFQSQLISYLCAILGSVSKLGTPPVATLQKISTNYPLTTSLPFLEPNF